MIRILFCVLFIGLSGCSIQDEGAKKEWIDTLLSKTFYGRDKKEVTVDKSSGNFTVDGTVYRFNDARTATNAIYTKAVGSYIGVIATSKGLEAAKYVDAVTAPSRQQNNIDFTTVEWPIALFTNGVWPPSYPQP